MNEKIGRIFRDRPLTAEEIARDADIRRGVQEEFPPAIAAKASGRLTQALKDSLRASGRSIEQIAEQAGVPEIIVTRFLSGERDIQMATADKLADALGLSLASTESSSS